MRHKIRNSKKAITFLVLISSLSLQGCVTNHSGRAGKTSSATPVAGQSVGQVEAMDFSNPVPHQALFRLLPSREWTGNLSNVDISGFLLMEIEKGCSAWNFNESLKLTMETNVTAQDLFFEINAVEAFDGSSYEFIFEQDSLAAGREIIEGVAERQAQGFDVMAEIRQEMAEEEDSATDEIIGNLPISAQFPISHTRTLLKAIQQGRHIVKSALFDGSDPEKISMANAVIVPYDSSYLSSVKAGKKLTEKKRYFSRKNNWGPHKPAIRDQVYKVSLGFYDDDDSRLLPDHEQKFILSDKGVILDMHLLIDVIPVHAELISLKLLDVDADACG